MSAENGLCDFFDARFYIFSYSCTCDDIFVGSVNSSMCVYLYGGVKKRCHLSWLPTAPSYMRPNAWGRGERGVAGPQPMSTDGAQINFGDITLHLIYGS